ncbi:hypothetical protein [Streptomyces sp. 4R-3d]|uniref:hypothetical protein n=1 Tax=Streptomyces sp. 4R-3d TaxID=2559605 RepID=UPI0010723503|nr:hypothetical protein [Streptomyces sp. 4R-3d]TFI30675.1 hypothetical protein E4P36_02665 [Streptomyces sp. 4R-3d]
MSAPAIRAGRVAARLSAAGLVPHATDLADLTYIETDLPGLVDVGTWREVLAALEEADCFGLVTSANGRRVWAAFGNEAPATVDAVRRHGLQP